MFTACDPIQADYTSAAKQGIAIVGKKEIGWLLELMPDIIKQIENSRVIYDLPEIRRWGE